MVKVKRNRFSSNVVSFVVIVYIVLSFLLLSLGRMVKSDLDLYVLCGGFLCVFFCCVFCFKFFVEVDD